MEQKRLPMFAERFNELRKGMSQDEFASFLGISRPTVGFYENGQRLPDAAVLKQIAETCSVSSDWLLGLTNDKKKIPSTIDEQGLTEASIEKLIEYRRSPAFRNTINAILEDRKFIRVLSNYLWSFTVWEMQKSKLKYIPLKRNTMPYTKQVMFATLIEYLPEFREALKNKNIDNKDLMREFQLNYLENHADMNECRRICFSECLPDLPTDREHIYEEFMSNEDDEMSDTQEAAASEEWFNEYLKDEDKKIAAILEFIDYEEAKRQNQKED